MLSEEAKALGSKYLSMRSRKEHLTEKDFDKFLEFTTF